MKKALVLCGGGSKGAYQMGCWTAIKELGLTFDIVTGTSIGSLNGAMFVQDAYDECLHLWKTSRNSSIMANPISLDGSLKLTLKKMEDLIPFVRSYISQHGVDITPFKKMMQEYIDPKKLKSSRMDFGVVTATFPGFKPFLVKMKEVDDSLIRDYILASSSCFPLFPVCKVKGMSLIDGGYYDNLPIDFALEMGANYVVAIDLNFQITHKEYLNKPFVKYIHPSRDLGNFFQFEEKPINDNMILGYNDFMKAYNKYLGYRYTFYHEKLDLNLTTSYTLLINRFCHYFKEHKLKGVNKQIKEYDLFNILEAYTYGNTSYQAYYIRGIEETLEFLGIDYLKVYLISEIKNLVYYSIFNLETSTMDFLKKYHTLKSMQKRREFLLKTNPKQILKELVNELYNNKEIDKNLVLDLLVTYPNLVIILALLKVWSDFDAEEEKNFGFEFDFESE